MEDLTPAEFDSVLRETSIPILIDFYSKTCAPCRALPPVLEELAEEMDGIVSFWKYDVAADEYRIASNQKVVSVPTLIIFKGGDLVSRRTGVSTKSDIRKWIEDCVE